MWYLVFIDFNYYFTKINDWSVDMASIAELFDLEHTLAKGYLEQLQYPWQALKGIRELILGLGQSLDPAEFTQVSDGVWVHRTARVAPTAYVGGPCIIGKDTEVRHCAFIRGSALVGEDCVVGNSTELKNVILFDGVQVPHYNYVGDSILGYKAHMGAGAITSNVKGNKTAVVDGIKKVGAFLGDFAEIGCNSVLNPGTVIGRNTQVYPLSSVRGTVPENHIYKDKDNVVRKK